MSRSMVRWMGGGVSRRKGRGEKEKQEKGNESQMESFVLYST